MENCIGCRLCVLACSLFKQGILSIRESSLRIKEKDGGFAVEFDLGICDGCGECLKVCPRNCLEIVEYEP